MSSIFNTMSWPMYLFTTLGSSIMFIVIARLNSLRNNLPLVTIGLTFMGVAVLTAPLTKVLNLLDLIEYANISLLIGIVTLLVGLSFSMIGGIKASKDNPRLNRKKLIWMALTTLFFILLEIAIVLIKIIERSYTE